MKDIVKKIMLFVLLMFLSFCLVDSFTIKAATYDPVRTIFTNPGEDSNNEMRINYHIDLDKSGSYVVYTEKTDTKWEKSVKVFAEEVENDAFVQSNANGEKFKQCGVVLSNLKSGTNYMYKVCLDNYESSVHYFKTGSQYFSFAWTSDFHAYKGGTRLNNATANILEAIELNNGVDFVLSTGDTIAHGGTYEYWNQLSTASWIQNYMYADTLGNHDWMTSAGTTVALGASHIFFGANHNNPKNGYDSQENICYYFYYGDALFICLNTEEFTQAQYDWCEEVLKNSEAQYKFIFQHYQMFNKNGSFCKTGYTRWYELCDKYGVDVAFSGNSHVYVRSRSIYNGELNTDRSLGTVYMTAPSSDGDRGMSPCDVTENKDIVAKNWAGGTYQVASSIVNVRENYITIKLINKGGEVLDSVTIPSKRGVSSRITKDISGIDTKSFEDTFSISVNKADLSKPYLNYNKEAYEAVKDITITEKNSGKVYYFGKLGEGSSKFKLENFPERETLDLVVKVSYWNNEVYQFEQKLINRKPYGTVTDFKASEISDTELKVSWVPNLKQDEIKGLELLVNGNKISDLNITDKNYTIKLDSLISNKDNEISLNIIDIEGDVIETLKTNYFLKTEVVLEKVEIKVVEKNDIIYPNDTVKLSFEKMPAEANDEFEWISSDTSIATVNNGLVTFKAKGKVIITVKSKINGNISDSIELEAIEKTEPTPTPQPKPSEDSGCSSGSVQAIWYVISILGIAFVLRKRFVK